MHHENTRNADRDNSWEKVTVGLLIATLFIIMYNAFQTSQLRGFAPSQAITSETAGVSVRSAAGGPDVIPKGAPGIYGKELGVSFDDVSASNQQKADATIGKLGALDTQISLTGNELTRYIGIVSQISCEYCCGAESIIFSNGQAACGCAHSFAMRGLAKYLIKNHGSEYTDNEILEELGKWKTLFFPTVMAQKAKVLQEKGIELNYVNLASNKYRGIEQGATGGSMVGGC